MAPQRRKENVPPPPWTASTMYAIATGHRETDSLDPCFFCGGPAKGFPAASYQSMLRTAPGHRFTPGCVNSDIICTGCHQSLREKCTVTMPPLRGAGASGLYRTQQMVPVRKFSWFITNEHAVACNDKADMHFLREKLLQPPAPPYACVIHHDGFHVMHKARAVVEGGKPTVYFNHQNVAYSPSELKGLLKLAGMVLVATHKVPESAHAEACDNRYVGGRNLYRSWMTKKKDNPVADLAVFLTPTVEECREMYPLENRDDKELSKTAGASA